MASLLFQQQEFLPINSHLGKLRETIKLVGGFNPFEKYKSNSSSPNRGEHNKYLKPPPREISSDDTVCVSVLDLSLPWARPCRNSL